MNSMDSNGKKIILTERELKLYNTLDILDDSLGSMKKNHLDSRFTVSRFYTVCIRPADPIPSETNAHIEKLLSIGRDIVDKWWNVKDKPYVYCLEQASEGNTAYHGYHIHMVIPTVKCKNIPRDIKNIAKKYFPDLNVTNKNFVRIDTFAKKGLDYWKDKFTYVIGFKHNEKQIKLQKDALFHSDYGLESFYTNDLDLCHDLIDDELFISSKDI